jgi:large repetitive protein
MMSRGTNNAKAGRGRIGILLFAFALSLLAAAPAQAQATSCSEFPDGVLDGFVNPVPPSNIEIDQNCTIRNFPASNPLSTNFQFFTQPGQTDERWLIIFDNVVHTGNMSCNAVHGHIIWFTNGSSTKIQEGCQNLLIPVEKINKQNPAGQTTATIGVPFTYTLTIPVLFDPATGTVIQHDGSPNDLHGIAIWDDLNETGADLTYLNHVAYWLDDGTPVPHTFSNVGGALAFEGIPIVQAGRQFVIELTVVLDDTPANAPGTQFINTAKWEFGRLIDDVFYQPLPGEWGVTPPMTIAAPQLVVTKSGPATMNLGEWGEFVIDVHNTGLSDAWDVTIRDLFPDGPAGGMCDQTPEILGVRVFAADGVTPVPGKGPLNPGSGYSLSYQAAPDCRLDITTLTAAGAIGPNERLIIRYRTQLDNDTQNGITLTNVAGAIQWFNGAEIFPDRQPYIRTLTDGTVGIADHEDAHTVTVALTGYFFEKTVANLTSGANPATTASPGDTLRYNLRFRNFGEALSDFRIVDEMDALNAPPAFVSGTLTLVTYPPGADVSATSSTGGASGTGVIDVRDLSVSTDGEALIQFDITLASTLTNGTVVTNQSSLFLDDDTLFALSDDPNVNGPADPDVPGDEDPTRVTIVSAPVFLVHKISTYLDGDPNVLLAGETLRYTITVKNIGNEDAVNVSLRDPVPVNTTYVAGSTTLNGVPVPDSGGQSPLVNGMLIHSPADPTPGSMPADASSNQANVATITFDVVVDPDVVDGTIISNQGFVTAIDQGIVDYPSDDPRTPIPNDPTRDIVGNLPLLYAEKRAELSVDLGSPGIVDPGDVLLYTITVHNSAAIPATGVVLTDAVPANTTYVANSTQLNGLPVGQPDGGVSPLVSGIDISSSDLTPPLPGPGAGTISPGATAVLQFELRVDDGTPAGTLIINQAVVVSSELPDLLTDGDGDPTTGPEPTVVVVGDGQQVSITKQVSVVGGGAAVPGAELEYVVRVVNFAAVPALNVVITDDLDASQPGQLAYVNASATMNGSSAGVSFAGSTITADYASTYGPLEPGETVVLRFRAILDPDLVEGTVVTNTGVVAWNTPTQTASASVSIVVGGIPGVAVLSGAAWHDANFDDARDSGERALADWWVDLYRDEQLVHSARTDTDGAYRIVGVEPNEGTGVRYELRFRAPGSGPNTAMLGLADSPFTNGLQRISDILVPPGGNVQGLNLPIDPNGVIYNSLARVPVAGAILTLRNAGTGAALPGNCFDDAAQQGQVTLADGYYKFDVNFSDPACPTGGGYLIEVTVPPGSTYVEGLSQIIPPTSDASTASFSVPACPGSPDDAIPATALFCEVQVSESAPAASVPPRSAGTVHHVHLMLDGSQPPGSSQIFNNHIPVDPELAGSMAISKTTPLLNVTRGQLVPYVITVNNTAGLLLTDVSIVDRFPAGFVYVEGSALLDGVPTEPSVVGLELRWDGLAIAGTEVRTVKFLLAVGAGVTEGEYVNRAQVVNGTTGGAMSGEATATVRVVPDPTFDCTDVTGKVFNDVNRNGVQDDGENGLPGVRVVTARGLQATTDPYGRYHITCAITPHESRGSNFVLKLDDRTLPSGFRMSTDPVQVKRATRGKALRINFGASIHRVVGIDLSDAAFEPRATDIRVQWRPRLDLLLDELCKAPAVLRLSYVADTEDAALVDQRLEAIKGRVTEAWDVADCGYPLTIEPEVFWRRGSPPRQPDVRVQDGR